MVAAVVERFCDAFRAAAPAGVEVRALADEFDRPALDGVSFLATGWGGEWLLDALDELPELRVVQALSAGTDWIEDLVPPWVTLCNARGARDAAVAEWALAALLGARTALLEDARDRVWQLRRPTELGGMRVVVVGYGSIGAALGERLAALGADVVAVARRPRAGVHGAGELAALLPGADAVVLLAPLTGDTCGMVDASFLARMRDGALLVNAGRGAVVETGALLAELQSGRLRAVLDVVDPEPLPDDHPLWRAPGTLAISSHHAGDTGAADVRAATLAGEQLGRFVRGEPLLNVVREAAR